MKDEPTIDQGYPLAWVRVEASLAVEALQFVSIGFARSATSFTARAHTIIF